MMSALMSLVGAWRGWAGERLAHRRIGEPLIIDPHQIAGLGDKPWNFECRPRRIADFAGDFFYAARAGKLDQGVEQHRADAAARDGRIDEEHVDDIALEAREANGPAFDDGDKR